MTTEQQETIARFCGWTIKRDAWREWWVHPVNGYHLGLPAYNSIDALTAGPVAVLIAEHGYTGWRVIQYPKTAVGRLTKLNGTWITKIADTPLEALTLAVLAAIEGIEALTLAVLAAIEGIEG